MKNSPEPLPMLLILTLILFGQGCHPSAQSRNDENQVVISRVQAIFDIKLEGCPTCGYMWYLQPFDSTALRILKHTTTPLNNSPGAAGGYAMEIWSLSGLRKGEYQLTFHYKRPWMEEVEKTAKFWVKIK